MKVAKTRGFDSGISGSGVERVRTKTTYPKRRKMAMLVGVAKEASEILARWSV